MLYIFLLFVEPEREFKMRKLNLFLKRAFDVFSSFLLMLFLIVVPVLIVIPILIRATSKGPAIFTQDRVGKDGKIFKIYKFRTMLIPEESFAEDGRPLEPKERITKVGKFLRKTSLDELAQLFNILNGTMSVVGPRPTIPEQVTNYDDRQKMRHNMRPGLTGWAQVNGRNDLPWAQKIEFDLEYIEKFNFLFDIKILFRTLAVIFQGKGIEFTMSDAISSGRANVEAATATEAEREKVSL